MRPGVLSLLLFLLAGIVVPGEPLAAQGGERTILLLPDEGGRVTAVAYRFPVGSAQDPAGSEGTAFLLGEVLEATGRTRLLGTGAELLAEVGEEEFLLTFLTPPDRLREVAAIMESLLGTEPLDEGVIDEARAGILDVLHFEAGSPVRDFERARSVLLLGEGSPAARPPMGMIPTVSLLDRAALEAYRRSHLQGGSAVVAIVGPVTEGEAASLFRGTVRLLPPTGVRPLPPLPAAMVGGVDVGEGASAGTDAEPDARNEGGVVPADGAGQSPAGPPGAASDPPALPLRDTSPLRVPATPTTPPAWSSGDRVEVDRELTSTWIAAAYPLRPGSPPLLLEFLSHLVNEALNPTPPDPGLFQVESSILWLGERPVLLISASVDPREAGRWEDRILGIVGALADSPPTGSFFDLARRRFRSSILLEMAAPENRVRWLAREGARGTAIPYDVEADLWRLDRDGIAGAAAGAFAPRVLLIGPLDMRAP